MQINKIRCFVHILVKNLTDLTNSQNQREKYHFSIDKSLCTLYNNNSKEQPLMYMADTYGRWVQRTV